MNEYYEKLLTVRSFSKEGPGAECVFYQYPRLSSTMDQARALLEGGGVNGDNVLFSDLVSFAPKLIVVSADEQTAGRGRKGRVWISKFNSGLWVTLGWESLGRGYPDGLSLSFGLGIKRALEKLGIAVMLKWPNDIVVLAGDSYRKLGGVLIETSCIAEKRGIYVGVGINYQTPSDVLGLPPISLQELGYQGDKFGLFKVLLIEVFKVVEQLYAKGFGAQQAEYSLSMAYRGDEVICIDGKREFSGRVVGVDKESRLILENQGEQIEIIAGDLSLKKCV